MVAKAVDNALLQQAMMYYQQQQWQKALAVTEQMLNKKATQKVIDEIDTMRKDLLKVMDKGGVTVVINNDSLVTVYNTNRHTKN